MDKFWVVVIAASVIAFILKLSGNLIPERYLAKPRIKTITTFVPIVMLAALVIAQTFSQGQTLVIDARLAGIIVAIFLLIFRAPFIMVVFGAALIAGLLRYFGLAN
jgi:branched-subunit amino acid transport protein